MRSKAVPTPTPFKSSFQPPAYDINFYMMLTVFYLCNLFIVQITRTRYVFTSRATPYICHLPLCAPPKILSVVLKNMDCHMLHVFSFLSNINLLVSIALIKLTKGKFQYMNICIILMWSFTGWCFYASQSPKSGLRF